VKTSAARKSIPRTPYLFFGGKGGVGKTTCAVSTALILLEEASPGEKILLFSTDPAHSLSDSLEIPIGNKIRQIAHNKSTALDAWEMDAGAMLAAFKAEHRRTLAEIADRGTMLDETDIHALLDLALPGLDEVMALFELSEFDRRRTYSRIVVDTAPSGHTGRLLELPEVFLKWIAALDRMSEKHRFMVSQIARLPHLEDSVDLFLRDMKERTNRVRSILFSPSMISFLLVTIPEAMAVEETKRYVKSLRQQGVPVTHIITNRLEQPHDKCQYCAARVAGQKPYKTQIKAEFKGVVHRQAVVMPDEVRGLESLKEFGSALWQSAGAAGSAGNPRSLVVTSPYAANASSAKAGNHRRTVVTSGAAKRVWIVGGKGGVGKTTTAAALAMELAQCTPERKFLVFSTDPAHSLSDSFSEEIGELKRGAAFLPNLDAIEINAVAQFEQLKKRYQQWVADIFAALTGGTNWEVQFDREAMQELISLAPPGIDEIAAFSTVSDFLEREVYTSIILDTAPTGHLLRFLELPHIALDWVRTFLRLLLKYRTVVTSPSVAEELIALSKNIKRVIAILTNSNDCEFLAVAVPERMSLAETIRLTEGVEKLHVNMGHVIINSVIPEDAAAGCVFCSARRVSQQRQIAAFRKQFSSEAKLLIAPQHLHEIRGPERLQQYLKSWTLLPAARREHA